MNLLQAILLAVVQGVTEFVPISSSGHLVLAREFLQWSDKGGLLMDVALHIGSLAAILVYFRRDWWGMLKGVLRAGSDETRSYRQLFWLLVIATIPAALIGPFVEGQMYRLRHGWMVGIIMIGCAGWFVFAERSQRRRSGPMRFGTALAMGIAQVFGLLPGMSRSGVTIGAGLVCGRNREEAARFSFMMAVPAILGAGGVTLLHAIRDEAFRGPPCRLIAVGLVICFIVSYASIAFCMRLFRKHSLLPFAVYLAVLGVLFVGARVALVLSG